MAFVQIIEFGTSNIEPTRQINEQWRRATEGKRTVRRELLARDHSDPSRYFAIAFFDSYDSAAENSSLPASTAIMGLRTGGPHMAGWVFAVDLGQLRGQMRLNLPPPGLRGAVSQLRSAELSCWR